MSGGEVSEEVRLARAGLSRAAEPILPAVGQLVARLGPVDAWAVLRSGRPQLARGVLAPAAARANGADPARDLATAAAVGARLVCPGDAEWPETLAPLARTGAVPLALWVRGARRLDQLCESSVAVVGTRAASEYGLYVAGELSAGLADRHYTIVSGGAYGIDAAAHRGALAAAGPTVAVLACGIDVGYPTGHAGLFESIAAAGALVSEHAPGTPPYRYRFLQRNRLIAGLTLGTVVVEAPARSGALSTAAHAARLGRQVMAVPGPVTSAGAAGCHRLIRSLAAVLVTRVEEVVEAVGRIGADLAPEPEDARAEDRLPAEARRVLDALPVRREAPPEAVASAACVPPAEVLGVLGLLAGLGLAEPRADGWRLAPRGRALRVVPRRQPPLPSPDTAAPP